MVIRSAMRKEIESGKGVAENGRTPVSMAGQLPHRGCDELVKDYDSDFPEPGCSPEHSGQSTTASKRGSRAAQTRQNR